MPARRPYARARATRVAIGRSGARIATRVERRLSNILSTSFNIFVVRRGIGANASAHRENDDTPDAWVVVMIDDAARREPNRTRERRETNEWTGGKNVTR